MIILYSSTNCAGCESLKSRLKEKHIAFDVVAIDKDAAAKEKVLGAGYRSVPQLFDTVQNTFITQESLGL